MELLARNLRKEQAAAQLRQPQIARRMQRLGFRWFGSTVSLVMRAKRKVSVEELVGLSLVLGVSPTRLLRPDDGESQVSMPNGFAFPAVRLMMNDGSVTWQDDEPVSGPTRASVLPADAVRDLPEWLRPPPGGE